MSVSPGALFMSQELTPGLCPQNLHPTYGLDGEVQSTASVRSCGITVCLWLKARSRMDCKK